MARMAQVVIPKYPLHTRTGRASGSAEFTRELEVFAGEELAPKRPDRKLFDGKLGTLSPEFEVVTLAEDCLPGL